MSTEPQDLRTCEHGVAIGSSNLPPIWAGGSSTCECHGGYFMFMGQADKISSRCEKCAPVAQEPPAPTEWAYGTKCPDCTSIRPPHHQRWCKRHPPLDLEALAAKWLEPCPFCDGGLPGPCTHPAEDYRVPMLALVLEVERLRGQS